MANFKAKVRVTKIAIHASKVNTHCEIQQVEQLHVLNAWSVNLTTRKVRLIVQYVNAERIKMGKVQAHALHVKLENQTMVRALQLALHASLDIIKTKRKKQVVNYALKGNTGQIPLQPIVNHVIKGNIQIRLVQLVARVAILGKANPIREKKLATNVHQENIKMLLS